MYYWYGDAAHKYISFCSIVPAPGQLSLLSPPADSRRWVSVHLTEEVHRIICQHHLVHRLFGEYWPLWNYTATMSEDRELKTARGATS